jgi:hypothetical protein
MMADKLHFRMDFEVEIVSLDEESRTFTAIVRPDPRRYEWKEVDGKRYLYDKLDNSYFPEEVFREGFALLEGKPMYFQPPKINDAEAYIKSRGPCIARMLEGCEPPPTFEDKSETFLQNLAVDKLAFVIISLDIVGSTRLAIHYPTPGPGR